jgi:thiol-disulfide isomerase/thioredoxin
MRIQGFMNLVVAAAAAAVLAAAPTLAGSTGGPAPNFTLDSREGGQLSLSELEGQVVMINFWATWCAPCRQEMPLLEEIYQRYAPLGFTLLGVNVEEDSAGADRWLRENVPVTFPILYDPENSVSELYDVNAMPTTVLVDRTGNVRVIHKGYKPGDESEYIDYVRSLIRE